MSVRNQQANIYIISAQEPIYGLMICIYIYLHIAKVAHPVTECCMVLVHVGSYQYRAKYCAGKC